MPLFQSKNFLLLSSSLLLGLVIFFSSISAYSNQQPTHHIVEITGYQFVPDTLNISVGDSVTWINKDTAPHSVINSADNTVISPNLSQGQKFTYVAKGAMDYHCGVHTSMLGKLTIN